MFLCLGLLVNPHEMLEVTIVALLIGVFMIVVGRPLSVFLCLLPFGKRITLKSRIRIVGRITWRSTHYLCHLSRGG